MKNEQQHKPRSGVRTFGEKDTAAAPTYVNQAMKGLIDMHDMHVNYSILENKPDIAKVIISWPVSIEGPMVEQSHTFFFMRSKVGMWELLSSSHDVEVHYE